MQRLFAGVVTLGIFTGCNCGPHHLATIDDDLGGGSAMAAAGGGAEGMGGGTGATGGGSAGTTDAGGSCVAPGGACGGELLVCCTGQCNSHNACAPETTGAGGGGATCSPMVGQACSVPEWVEKSGCEPGEDCVSMFINDMSSGNCDPSLGVYFHGASPICDNHTTGFPYATCDGTCYVDPNSRWDGDHYDYTSFKCALGTGCTHYEMQVKNGVTQCDGSCN